MIVGEFGQDRSEFGGSLLTGKKEEGVPERSREAERAWYNRQFHHHHDHHVVVDGSCAMIEKG